jgi:trimeric autotransporter adhesin
MSTKTTFKRIALVAVAALGLGVLSVAPSSATTTAVSVTGANGTSTLSATGYVSDSTTAATVSVAGLLDAAGNADTITVYFLQKSVPAGATGTAYSYLLDTTTPNGKTLVDTNTAVAAAYLANPGQKYLSASDTLSSAVAIGGAKIFRIQAETAGYVGAKFAIQLDSTTSRIAGTYTYTAVVKSYSAGSSSIATTTQDVSIVVAADATTTDLVNGTISSTLSTAILNAGALTTSSTWTALDSSVAVVATAASTDHASIRVRTYTAAGNPAPESVTATVTGPGIVCNGGACGKSLKILGTGGDNVFTVRADGTAGVASIVIATTTRTFPAKTVTFFAKAAKTFTVKANKPVIGATAATDVVRVTAVDADGNNWGGAAYIYAVSAADALIAGSETPVACTYDAVNLRHACPVSGTTSGTANFKIIDASTVAKATATSDAIAIRVSAAAPASVKLAFDKATYAPGERATITATVLDAAGLALPLTTVTNLFAAGGITASYNLTAVSTQVLTDVSPVVKEASSTSDANNPTTAGAVTYVYYMPTVSGDVTLTAKGGTGLPVSGQVTVTAKATVVNSSVDAATDAANEATDAANAATDAALAAADAADAATAAAQDASDAVAALSASVEKLVASLKAQLTSLTNLVIKIQKKVKA